MTLHATRDGQGITIHGNNGVSMELADSRVVRASITEDIQHVRYFWGQLGGLLDAAENEAREVTEALEAERRES